VAVIDWKFPMLRKVDRVGRVSSSSVPDEDMHHKQISASQTAGNCRFSQLGSLYAPTT